MILFKIVIYSTQELSTQSDVFTKYLIKIVSRRNKTNKTK